MCVISLQETVPFLYVPLGVVVVLVVCGAFWVMEVLVCRDMTVVHTFLSNGLPRFKSRKCVSPTQ